MKTSFEKEKHVKYFLKHLEILPSPYASQDTNRLTILYFCLCGLDIMKSIDLVKNKKEIIDFIYSLKIKDEKKGGFIGGTFIKDPNSKYYKGHITMTYVALCCLLILEDDLKRVEKKEIISSLKYLQSEEGCFQATYQGGDTDMRFTFCACAISWMLNDWNGVDIEKTTKYILDSSRYDFSYPHELGLEGHGGYTYCALSALYLMGKLKEKNENLIEWLLFRQEIGGFNGRPHKDQDTCYSFWVGASLSILDSLKFIDGSKSIQFTLSCQFDHGGICKCQGVYPDPLHSFMSISGLALLEYESLNPIFPPIGITKRCLKDYIKE